MEIRAAELNDAGAIADVQVRSWRSAYLGLMPQHLLDGMLDWISAADRTVMWEGHITTGRRIGVSVAVDGDEVVGFIALSPARDDDSTVTTAEVTALYLVPEAWGRGAGTQLMEGAVETMASLGMTEATLWVLRTNGPARAFYEAAGWRADGTERVEVMGGEPIDEVRYRRSVP